MVAIAPPAAAFAEREGDRWRCRLCPNRCLVAEGGRGSCLARGVRDGRFLPLSYGVVTSARLDPIEKKPLYHFHPGAAIFSVGGYGCNLHCCFCQNCEISQEVVPGETVPPERLVAHAVAQPDSIGVAFTYNEPTIAFEYLRDSAPLLRARGQKVVLVTNGYLEPEPWAALLAVTDALNIDLKGFTDAFYRDACGGRLAPVQANIAAAVKAGRAVELTHLVVTGLNDRDDDFSRLVDWVATLEPAPPLHLSRYFPRHRHGAPPTDPGLLERWYTLARGKLPHVFVGNLATAAGQDSHCPGCGALWVRRRGYRVEVVAGGPVCTCGRPIPIVGLGATGGGAPRG